MLISALHFLAMLLIVGTVLRLAEAKLAERDSALGRALSFAY